MKASIILLLALCSLGAYVEATYKLGTEIEHPDSNNNKHNGHCYARRFKVAMAKGEVNQNIRRCETAKCLEDGSVQYSYCQPFVMVFAPCELTDGDRSKPWPQCCSQSDCPEDEMLTKLPKSHGWLRKYL